MEVQWCIKKLNGTVLVLQESVVLVTLHHCRWSKHMPAWLYRSALYCTDKFVQTPQHLNSENGALVWLTENYALVCDWLTADKYHMHYMITLRLASQHHCHRLVDIVLPVCCCIPPQFAMPTAAPIWGCVYCGWALRFSAAICCWAWNTMHFIRTNHSAIKNALTEVI